VFVDDDHGKKNFLRSFAPPAMHFLCILYRVEYCNLAARHFSIIKLLKLKPQHSLDQQQLKYLWLAALQGDSGGPLVCGVKGKYVLAGATSWGKTGCQTDGYPSVYTRISKYLRWIAMNIV